MKIPEQIPSKLPPARLWALAAALVTAAAVFSYLRLPPGEELSVLFFRQWMLLGMLLSGLIMSLTDPNRWRYWAVAVGLFPVSAVVVYMVVRGPGNIWPIALALAFTIGIVPAFVGAALGRGLRGLITRHRNG